MSSAVSAALSESFEEVLNAVQETSRGRWFLEEFSKRNASQDTKSILAAITRLEGLLPSQANHAEAALVNRARAAIAKARSQITQLQPNIPDLSEEARLFAKMAELSRNAFSADQQSLGKGVDVVLNLVQDLDQSFGTATATVPTNSNSYFQADQGIFETPAPAQTPVPKPKLLDTPAIQRMEKPADTANTAAAAPKPPHSRASEDMPRGAKLTINRTGAKPTTEVTPAHAETRVAEIVPAAPAAETKPEFVAEKSDKPRIMITRRKAEEIMPVPLIDEPKAEDAA